MDTSWSREEPTTRFFSQFVDRFTRHWLLWTNLFLGSYALLPWLSPLLRALGYETAGRALYLAYRPFCHQRPELSYHLWGYPVAYCHRDTAIYTALFLAGLAFGFARTRLRPLPGWAFVLFALPLAADGFTQLPRAFLPDWPLRVENRWAVALTFGRLPERFYYGDAVGSLNWWLRTVTGVLFAVGLAWAVFPRVEREARLATAYGHRSSSATLSM